MQSARSYKFESSESEEESSDSNIKIALKSRLIANQLQKLVKKIKTLEEQII
jgi:hypothetical protein